LIANNIKKNKSDTAIKLIFLIEKIGNRTDASHFQVLFPSILSFWQNQIFFSNSQAIYAKEYAKHRNSKKK
jgi:hypothetical protein